MNRLLTVIKSGVFRSFIRLINQEILCECIKKEIKLNLKLENGIK